MLGYTVACLPCIDGLLADKFLNGNVITFDKRNSAPLYSREFKNNPQVVLVVEIADAFKCYIIASCDAEGKKVILSGNKYHFLLQMKKMPKGQNGTKKTEKYKKLTFQIQLMDLPVLCSSNIQMAKFHLLLAPESHMLQDFNL